MEKICLTRREKYLLLSMKNGKKIKPEFDVSQLVSFGLIRRDYSGKKNDIGEQLPDDTYSITDYGHRYLIHKREEYFTRKLPVVISLIALIKSFWPEISALTGWLLRTAISIANQFHP